MLLISLVALPLGALSGSAPPAVDRFVLRVLEGLQAFPRLFLLLGLAAIVRPGVLSVVLILGLTGWIPMARLVRAEVRALRDRDFVLAARAAGAGRGRIVLRHLLPNALAPALVEASLAAASAIVNEAALSFLGFGLQPPDASWGNMIADGRATLASGWWVAFFPGAALALDGDRLQPGRRGTARRARPALAVGGADELSAHSLMLVGDFDFDLPRQRDRPGGRTARQQPPAAARRERTSSTPEYRRVCRRSCSQAIW